MKLSEDMKKVLVNFSEYNTGVILRPGNLQNTLSINKAVFVSAEMEPITDHEFGIYDLKQFLGNVTTLNDPELTFKEGFVIIDDGELTLKYFATPTTMIHHAPSNAINFGKSDVSFYITDSKLSRVLKIALMNKLPNIAFVCKSGVIDIIAHDKKNPTTNAASIELCKWDGEDFTAVFNSVNLRFLPNDYNVEVRLGKMARFTSSDNKLTYIVSLDV